MIAFMNLSSDSFSKKDSYSYASSVNNSMVFVNVTSSLWLANKPTFVKSVNLCTNTSFTVFNSNDTGRKCLTQTCNVCLV